MVDALNDVSLEVRVKKLEAENEALNYELNMVKTLIKAMLERDGHAQSVSKSIDSMFETLSSKFDAAKSEGLTEVKSHLDSFKKLLSDAK
jgi:hypothetical protein